MRHIFILLTAPLLLAGCAARHVTTEPPVVDMTGVDPARYNADVRECIQEKIARNAQEILVGYAVSDCMARKGYRILAYKD